ncbi:MAG: hypothetical protein AAGF12_41790 [Myxococcota bacterium]
MRALLMTGLVCFCFGCPESRTTPLDASVGDSAGRDASLDANGDRTVLPETGPICTNPRGETCDGTDQDCDGLVDEGIGASVGCGLNEECISGSCGCPAERLCGGQCVNTAIDERNCGSCGNTCPTTQACVEETCCVPLSQPVDLLFVIDNSISMGEEQESLASEFPELFRALTTGDVNNDSTAEFPPVTDLNFGVVTTDMGTGAFEVVTCGDPFDGDDGILQTESASESGCAASYPSVLSYRGGPVGTFASDAACLAIQGIDGCGFEQQLEAPLKAVSSAASGISFFGGTSGHSDGANAGFKRPGSTLAVVLVTDESDCSAADPELFNQNTTIYVGDLNLRCFQFPDALHGVSRYVDGLLQASTSPEQFVFGVLAGIPEDLVGSGSSTILADPRMQPRVSAMDPTRLETACTSSAGVAFPATRMIQTAQGLEGRGAATAIGSICSPSYAGFVESLATRIAGASTACM